VSWYGADVPATWACARAVAAGAVADGPLWSTVTACAVVCPFGPTLPATSETDAGFSARTTDPDPQPLRATLPLAPPPVGAPTVQPVAVPLRVKSMALSPLMDSLKTSEYVRVAAAVGVAGRVSVAVGGVRSTVTLAALAWLAGPALDARSCTV